MRISRTLQKQQKAYNKKHGGYETELIKCREGFECISSTAARAALNSGKICDELLPEKVEDEPEEEIEAPKAEATVEYNKYAAAYATIVYEQFSNGKTFILNFNNFAVKVNVNGISYTIAAYGYVEIK